MSAFMGVSFKKQLLQSYLGVSDENCCKTAEEVLDMLKSSHSALTDMFRDFLRDVNLHPDTCPRSPFTPKRARPSDMELPLVVSLEDLYNGTMKETRVSRELYDSASGHTLSVQETMHVAIQPGMRCGSRVKLAGRGNEHAYEPASDVVFTVEQQQHPVFSRRADDLYASVTVPLVTALTGGEISLRRLDGQILRLSVNGVVLPGSELTLAGEGMPVSGNPCRRGQLHIKFEIVFPNQLTALQQQQFKAALAGAD